jgi:hypothetical protein
MRRPNAENPSVNRIRNHLMGVLLFSTSLPVAGNAAKPAASADRPVNVSG